MTIPELTTDRLLLRGLRAHDFDDFARTHGDPVQAKYIGGACSREEAWLRMATMMGHWLMRGFGLWAIEEKASGQFAGCAGLWCPEGWPEVELGYWLIPKMVGRGYATEAAKRARQFAIDTLGLTSLVSYIDPENTASIAVVSRMGAQFEKIMEGGVLDKHSAYRHPVGAP